MNLNEIESDRSEAWFILMLVFLFVGGFCLFGFSAGFGAQCAKHLEKHSLGWHECVHRMTKGEKIFEIIPDIKQRKEE